jgi:hypothetical protein
MWWLWTEPICEDDGRSRKIEILLQLVGGFNHLEKYESQWEG